jgi:hypothetical protein
MKKYTVLLLLMTVLSCKTMTKSISLGGTVGVLSGAGLGGGIYWQDRRKAAILSGVLGLGIGLASGYFLHNEKESELLNEIKNTKKTEKEIFEKRISEALSYCMDEEKMPVLRPKLREAVKKGGKILGGGVNWEIKPNEFNLTPEKVELLEEIERRNDLE